MPSLQPGFSPAFEHDSDSMSNEWTWLLRIDDPIKEPGDAGNPNAAESSSPRLVSDNILKLLRELPLEFMIYWYSFVRYNVVTMLRLFLSWSRSSRSAGIGDRAGYGAMACGSNYDDVLCFALVVLNCSQGAGGGGFHCLL